jgi:6,7-dimethyl-8-ribityllumazine synthase
MADGDAIEAKGIKPVEVDGSGLRVGILHTRWNAQIVNALVAGATDTLRAQGVSDILVKDVPAIGTCSITAIYNRYIFEHMPMEFGT